MICKHPDKIAYVDCFKSAITVNFAISTLHSAVFMIYDLHVGTWVNRIVCTAVSKREHRRRLQSTQEESKMSANPSPFHVWNIQSQLLNKLFFLAMENIINLTQFDVYDIYDQKRNFFPT